MIQITLLLNLVIFRRAINLYKTSQVSTELMQEQEKNSNEKSNPAKISNTYSALFENDENENSIYTNTGATVICVKPNNILKNENPSSGMQIGSCSNHILCSKTQGKLPIQELPNKAQTAHKVDGININLLSIGTVCNQQCVGIFKKKKCSSHTKTTLKSN